MDINCFNEVCQSLRRQQAIQLQLHTGEVIRGFIVRINFATSYEGSLELATARGVESFLSSSISEIIEASTSA